MNNIGGKNMKEKTFGIFVSVIVISTIITPVVATTESHDFMEYNIDLPVWGVGDEWTYHFIESVTGFLTYSLSGDLTLKIIEDSGESYVLEGTTKPQGTFTLIGSLGLKTTMLTSLTMKLHMRKSDLGLEYFSERLKGIFLFKIGPFTLPIPIHADLNIEVEFEPTWVIMPFPLYDGKYGNLSSSEFWHTNNYIRLFWGMIPIIGPMNVSWPITQVPYTCYTEELTVDAGTFNVCNISAEWMDGSRFVSYYAEDVGNAAKELIYLPHGMGPVERFLILELKNYSYSP